MHRNGASHLEKRARKLLKLPAQTDVSLRWDVDGEKRVADGTICEYDRQTPVRTVDTGDRTLVLTVSSKSGDVTISEVTPTGSTDLGTLCLLIVTECPLEELRLTDAGVEVPSVLVGYTGTLWVEPFDNPYSVEIPAPGLEQYDDRLLSRRRVMSLPASYTESVVTIEPTDGPRLQYSIVDDRTPSYREAPEPDPSYSPIESAITEIHTVSRAIYADRSFRNRQWRRALRALHDVQTELLWARTVLLETPPEDTLWEYDSSVEQDWRTYDQPLMKVNTRCIGLSRMVKSDEELSQRRSRRARERLARARAILHELRSWLRPVVGAHRVDNSNSFEIERPHPSHVDTGGDGYE